MHPDELACKKFDYLRQLPNGDDKPYLSKIITEDDLPKTANPLKEEGTEIQGKSKCFEYLIGLNVLKKYLYRNNRKRNITNPNVNDNSS